MMRNILAPQHMESKEFNKGVKKNVKYSVPSKHRFRSSTNALSICL